MSESYDYYKCEICNKIKPVGSELVRKIAFSQKCPKAQDETKQEARIVAYYMLICSGCETEAQPQ